MLSRKNAAATGFVPHGGSDHVLNHREGSPWIARLESRSSRKESNRVLKLLLAQLNYLSKAARLGDLRGD